MKPASLLANEQEKIETADGAIVINKTINEARPAMLTLDKLADWGLERAGVENLIATGKVRSVRVGRKLAVVVDDLVALATAAPKAKKLAKVEPFLLADAIAARGRK